MEEGRYKKRPDMTWHDHLIMLLHLGAEIEHGLMVQYLYAAYSLGGKQIPEQHRAMIEGWRDAVLSVAREEMGHLLTVQNLLVFVGASVNFDRDDFPWDKGVYPFAFSLQPFSMDSLRRYIYAEMPRPESLTAPPRLGKRAEANYVVPSVDFQKDMIHQIVDELGASESLDAATVREGMHRVGELYDEIIDVISNATKIPDSIFDEASYEIQASWDEWGRGYRPPPRMLDAEGNIDSKKPTPVERDAHVLVDRVATRTDAVKALRSLAGQGEGPHVGEDQTTEPSHFERFLTIYEEWKNLDTIDWKPAGDIPTDPTTRTDFARYAAGPYAQTAKKKEDSSACLIDAIAAKHLAQIFNERYRMLLAWLAHSFRLARTTTRDRPNLRGMVMHRAFGEMYNLKALAGLLVRLPRHDDGSPGFAGPPFEMPYSLNLPQADVDIWRRHDDLLQSSQTTCHRMLHYIETRPFVKKQLAAVGGEAYVRTLMDLDEQARTWIAKIIAGGS
jgi:hypothetical protein